LSSAFPTFPLSSSLIIAVIFSDSHPYSLSLALILLSHRPSIALLTVTFLPQNSLITPSSFSSLSFPSFFSHFLSPLPSLYSLSPICVSKGYADPQAFSWSVSQPAAYIQSYIKFQFIPFVKDRKGRGWSRVRSGHSGIRPAISAATLPPCPRQRDRLAS
jgi:hypothetical protein